MFIAVLVGGGAGQFLASAATTEQVVIGNTGGTLSAIIRVDKALIVFGGGNARSDLADLLGRSTLPWTRHVDLLIIPGWDNQQALGALGLLEREAVGQIVILGQPSTTTIWTVLYQTASRRAVPVTVASQRSTIEISPEVSLDLTSGDALAGGTAEFALLTLHFHAVQLLFLDAADDSVKALNRVSSVPARTHALVLSRVNGGLRTTATLRVEPSASKVSDFDLASSSYQRELGSGERITIGLAADQLRVDLADVQRNGGATPSETPAASAPEFRGNLHRWLTTNA